MIPKLKPILTIVCGLPGSGKSAYARELATTNRDMFLSGMRKVKEAIHVEMQAAFSRCFVIDKGLVVVDMSRGRPAMKITEKGREEVKKHKKDRAFPACRVAAGVC